MNHQHVIRFTLQPWGESRGRNMGRFTFHKHCCILARNDGNVYPPKWGYNNQFPNRCQVFFPTCTEKKPQVLASSWEMNNKKLNRHMLSMPMPYAMNKWRYVNQYSIHKYPQNGYHIYGDIIPCVGECLGNQSPSRTTFTGSIFGKVKWG